MDLHDALEDAKQIPIIMEGLERLAGPGYSLAALAGQTCNEPFKARSFDLVVRKRRVKINEKLAKTNATGQLSDSPSQKAGSHHSLGNGNQRSSTSSARVSQRCGCLLLFVQLKGGFAL
ncbi:MAG: hypothetical protein HC767_04220 [Akkermansiaceae bacterium]|nr:hypothetical protein [Akkermansiaceae bacterium]